MGGLGDPLSYDPHNHIFRSNNNAEKQAKLKKGSELDMQYIVPVNWVPD